METHLQERKSEKLNIFDLGSQNIGGTYRHIFEQDNWNYIGVDLDFGNNVDVILKDAYKWSEIKSESIDVVVSGQTLEHIEYPWLSILEIARILKPGGLCCLIAPSSGYEHRYPVDCWRVYPDGMKALSNFARLEVLEAYTQWEDESYTDGSNVWHDTVLIARKPTDNAETIKNCDYLLQQGESFLSKTGQLEVCALQLKNLKLTLESLRTEINQLQTKNEILRLHKENMEKSFFWKTRTKWFQLKSIFH